MNIPARELRIILIEGPVQFTAEYANSLLAGQPPDCRVVDIEYNYQAPEIDDTGEKMLMPGHHGILLALTGYVEPTPPPAPRARRTRTPKPIEVRSRHA